MPELAESIVISTCLGALVGLIHQWEVQRETPDELAFAGVRTFAVVALLGCLAAFSAERYSPGAFVVTLGLLGVLLAVAQAGRGADRAGGYTTPGASVLTFFAGALVHWGERQGAVLVAALTVLLLALKRPLHDWTRRFTAADVRSTLQFIAITGVVLPLVPNRELGPWGAFNPRSVWLMVVLISGLGFLGYLLVRLLGNRAGVTLTGLVGGLASSTATTLAFSRRSREDPGGSMGYALAVVLACTVMLIRVVVIAAAIEPGIVGRLALPVAVMAVPGLAFGAWVWIGRRPAPEPVEAPAMSNPLSLSVAVKFALLYALVQFLVKAASQADLAQGIVAVCAVAGLTDVDALTASVANSVREGSLEAGLATIAIVVGCISNTVVKAGLGVAFGSPALRRWLIGVLASTAVAGGAGLVLLVRWGG